jgi:hypothetical protein
MNGTHSQLNVTTSAVYLDTPCTSLEDDATAIIRNEIALWISSFYSLYCNPTIRKVDSPMISVLGLDYLPIWLVKKLV